MAIDSYNTGDLFLLGLGLVLFHDRDVPAAPIHNKSLADEEEHDGYLGDREEAPYAGLLHEVRGDPRGEAGSEGEQEHSLDDHALLLVEREEGGKHEEGVNGGAHDIVGRVGHRDRPAKVPHGQGLEGAEFLATKPLGALVVGDVHHVQLGDERKEISDEQKKAANCTQPLDDDVSVAVLLALGQRAVDDVAEVGLHADVQEAKDGQNLVNGGLANGRV